MRQRTREQGFTLIEVLAAVVLISIVAISLTSYFLNSMSYSKQNQNKTIMSHLARNALVFVQDDRFKFDNLKTYFETSPTNSMSYTEYPSIIFEDDTDGSLRKGIFNPIVNEITYDVTIEYQKDLHSDILNEKGDMAELLLPVIVTVKAEGVPEDSQRKSVVEGYIIHGDIRYEAMR